jgi:hypothetical protein
MRRALLVALVAVLCLLGASTADGGARIGQGVSSERSILYGPGLNR